ncbi:MAG: Uma2 family endonuclease [Caldilineaceae bacterium]|nr:Uma2 family endonuclease [Caldilineaceae bacterium]
MTVSQSTVAERQPPALPPLPDPPRRNPDESRANFQHLAINGGALHLARHFGHPDTTLLGGDLYLAPFPPDDMAGIRYPDMLIAFDVDPEAYHRRNAYIISEQGKPPDFVLEIGSPSTGQVDVEEKRDDYAALGIPEYWRFDETGQSHGTRLAGDRLVDGVYRPIAIEELAEDILQGHSTVLHLDLRWERGQLKWHDPETGRHIPTYDDHVARAEEAEARIKEAEAALRAVRKERAATKAAFREERQERAPLEAKIRAEREARAALEAKVRELEAQLQRSDPRSG